MPPTQKKTAAGNRSMSSSMVGPRSKIETDNIKPAAAPCHIPNLRTDKSRCKTASRPPRPVDAPAREDKARARGKLLLTDSTVAAMVWVVGVRS